MRIATRATVHSERTRQSRRGARDTWPVHCRSAKLQAPVTLATDSGRITRNWEVGNSLPSSVLLAKQVGTYDESEVCKLLLEISLLDSAYQRSTASRDDVLMDAAKRYRVDTDKLQKAVAEELATKREKKTKAGAKPKNRKTA